jgi:hypothetical protein
MIGPGSLHFAGQLTCAIKSDTHESSVLQATAWRHSANTARRSLQRLRDAAGRDPTAACATESQNTAVQVAAYADTHVLVQKLEAAGRTETAFKVLDDASSRAAEVADMLGLDAAVAERLLRDACADIASSAEGAAAAAARMPTGGAVLRDDEASASEAAAQHGDDGASDGAKAQGQRVRGAAGVDGDKASSPVAATDTAAGGPAQQETAMAGVSSGDQHDKGAAGALRPLQQRACVHGPLHPRSVRDWLDA